MKTPKRKRSITVYLIIVIAVIIVVQFSLILGGFVFGGILSGTRKNAYVTFNKVVTTRITFLQNEINNRWTSINPNVNQIRKKLEIIGDAEHSDVMKEKEFLLSIENDLVTMMRGARVTDCYVILDNQGSGDQYQALYLRDEDPNLDDIDNKDICLLAGPAEMTKRYASIEDWWDYRLELNEHNDEFYKIPFQCKDALQNYSNLGYWSRPFSLNEYDSPRLAYSMPLVDEKGVTRGVIGIGISVSYLNRYLPSEDMAKRDSLGYIIGKSEEDEELYPVVTRGAYQERMLNLEEGLDLIPVDRDQNIYQIGNSTSKSVIYGCMEEISLYPVNSPYAGENWYLIGLQEEGKLLALEYQIKNILIVTLLSSLVLSMVIGGIGFFKFTRPIVELADKVSGRKFSEEIILGRTGFYELDELEEAIEIGHKNFMDAQSKISQVVDLVDIPIGVFRYRNDVSNIMATTKLPSILGFSEEEREELLQDSNKFLKRLKSILENEDAEHSGIYKISEDPEKWIKVNIVEQNQESLGIVIDITEEQQETAKLRQERNYDVLTGLYSRRYFRDCIRDLLEDGDLGVCAGIMFDIDEFKKINDSYGHSFGDRYLRETARCLMEMSSSGCIAGRRSGDEFYAFLYDFGSRDEIRNIVQQFYQKLRNRPMLFPDRTNRIIEVSAGIAWYEKDEMNYEVLLDNADQALYKAKEMFKGYFVEF